MALSTIQLQPTQLVSTDPSIALGPSWRVLIDGETVTESLFRLNHRADPVQIAQCSHCGEPWCAPGGAVSVRQVGDAVVWLRPIRRPEEERDEGRVRPLDRVAEQPVWFSAAEYRDVMRTPRLRELTGEEASYLLRSALMKWLGPGDDGEPPTWTSVRALTLFAEAEPSGDVDAARLLTAAARLEQGDRPRLDAIVGSAPASACRLIEGFDTPTSPVLSRLIASPGADGSRSLWHLVGEDCWARLSFSDPGRCSE